jgi:flavodoxin
MNIGIIVYSITGHTLSVAQKLNEKLLTNGHSVSLERVIAINDEQTDIGKIQFSNAPSVEKYDALIFGAPVRGLSLSAVMAAYLSKFTSLKGKKIICYVTQYFPYPWMGGNRSIKQMKKICESKGAKIFDTGIVNWSNSKREKKITDLVDKLSKDLNSNI